MGGPVTVGIDVGGTKILGLALDGAGAVVAEAKAPTPRLAPGGAGVDAVIEAIAVVVETVLQDLGPEAAAAVGVGVPGMVDDEGVLHFAANLPGGEGLAVGSRLGARLPSHRM
ncbi:MAG: ROK family protein, partial [Acidimicrobiales bacterium]